MKAGRVGPNEVFYRCLTPRWAHAPTSGAGAARNGGRFNRPGSEAVYLARHPLTALEEYRQGATIVPPGTLAAYHVSLSSVTDLSEGYDPALWEASWTDGSSDWLNQHRAGGKAA
jgi:RES domain-containing protein